jgi:hypothetical protein
VYLDPASGEKKGGVAKVAYSHLALIDLIITNPAMTQREMAHLFGYTEGWVSQILASDSFQLALETRKEEVVNPAVRATVEERLKGLVIQSTQVLHEAMDGGFCKPEIAVAALRVSAQALGYGARGPTVQVNNYVVELPGKAASSGAWEAACRGNILDMEVINPEG